MASTTQHPRPSRTRRVAPSVRTTALAGLAIAIALIPWLAAPAAQAAPAPDAADVPAAQAAPAPQAFPAAKPGENIDGYLATYDLAEDGSVRVSVTFAYNPGTDGGHGPFLRVPVQVATDDPDVDRAYPLSEVSATSLNAPDDVRVETKRGIATIYVGASDTTFTGTGIYTITYRQEGVVTPGEDTDEFDWTVLEDVDFRVADVGAVVTAPAPATGATCAKPGGGHACHTVDVVDPDTESPLANIRIAGLESPVAPQGSAVFSTLLATRGAGLRITATYPAGTFPDAAVITADPSTRTKYVFEWNAWTIAGAISVGVLLAAIALRIVLSRLRRDAAPDSGALLDATRTDRPKRRGRAKHDESGADPWGTNPAGADPWGTNPTGVDPAVTGPWGTPPTAFAISGADGKARRTVPPVGLEPWQVATLDSGEQGTRDLTALVTDLARRGVIAVEPLAPVTVHGKEMGNWAFHALASPRASYDRDAPGEATGFRWAGLSAAEVAVLLVFFRDQDTVTLAQLRGDRLARATEALARQTSRDAADAGWFRPGRKLISRVKGGGCVLGGILFFGGGAILGVGGSMGYLGPTVLAFVSFIVATIIAVAGPSRAGYTALGARLAAESEAFREHLADVAYRRVPLRGESQYAAWAVAFGLARSFAGLAENDPAVRTDFGTATPWWAFLETGTADMLARVPSDSSDSGSSSSSDSSSSSSSSSSSGGSSSVGGW